MDTLFLQLTNQVEAGYHNEKMSLENACYKIARAEEEIKRLESQIANIESETPTLIKEHKGHLWDLAIHRTCFYIILSSLTVFLKQQAPNFEDEILINFLLSPLVLLIAGNLLAICYISEMCGLWECHRSLSRKDNTEQIAYFMNELNRKIAIRKGTIETNTEKAKHHAENMKELIDIHNRNN
ncbi:hypothetical protein ACNE9Y_29995 [Pseudomonas sp. NY11226]|uniref:hypothetical protein n=1 Tax=Pseudomonas sp. NY11226 TaxID=3400362 RepID=UPI003A87743F